MIESIEFKNFKALRDTTLPLGRFTLIVGPNGSGKSTALQAIESVKNAPVIDYHQVVTAGVTSPIKVTINFYSKSERYKLSGVWSGTGVGTHEGQISTQEIQNWRARLQQVETYSLDENAIVAPVSLQTNLQLHKSGLNLAGVLDQLRDDYPERFEELNEALGKWLPEFDRILFETTNTGLRGFALRMLRGHYKIHARDLSQGTLFALTILTLAYLPTPPAVIGLEEPDRGIHPRLLRDVQDALYRLAYPENYGETREPVQVIATTHSPYFLDLFRDHPEEVVLANKTDEGTKFERLSDQPNLNEILEDSHLGEVWYTGILGGVPAHA